MVCREERINGIAGKALTRKSSQSLSSLIGRGQGDSKQKSKAKQASGLKNGRLLKKRKKDE